MSASRNSIGSDLEKVDAYRNSTKDYDDIPELDEAFFARAVNHRNGVPVGQSLEPENPTLLTLTMDPEVIARFRAAGPDWKARMSDILRKSVGL